MKKAISGGRTRVVYGTREITAEHLASKLARRCLRELPNASQVHTSRAQRNSVPVERSRYYVSKVTAEETGTFAFLISSEYWDNEIPDDAGWAREWVTLIEVAPNMEIFYTPSGSVSPSHIESLLDCALRGPD